MTSQDLDDGGYELHEDTYDAFVCGIQPAEQDPLNFYESPKQGYISVPSRKHLPVATPEKPLSGMIFAVKDIYDVKGVITSACSKAYIDLQVPATETAPCIQRLIDQGAIPVGKVKTVQFASGMSASDWVDYGCPINPRGDGNLDPDCSSAGSAAAVAGYEWLDFSVGSDSLGSMIGPASACGVFGLRPTHGILSNVGAIPVSSVLDTPGPFARSITDLITITKAWCPALKESLDVPTKLIVPEGAFLPFVSDKRKVMEDALEWLARNIAPKAEINLGDLWKSAIPMDARLDTSTSFEKKFATTLAHIQLYDSYHNSAKFREAYQAKHGKAPILDPLIQFKRDLGSQLTKEQYETALEEKATFKEFLKKQVLTPGTIMVLPGGMEKDVRVRDESAGNSIEVNGMVWQGFGLLTTTYSALGGFPCVSIPVGQRPYIGKSGETSFQPVSLWILGPAGSDIWLMKQIEKCLPLGQVLAGKKTFQNQQA